MAGQHESFIPGRALSAEEIARVTGFVAIQEYEHMVQPDGFLPSEFHQEMGRLSEQYGVGSVISSFFVDGDGTVQFGIFLKKI